MSLPATLLTAYLVIGLLFGLVVVISERKRKSSFGPTAGFVDEYTFWFFLLLWPVMGAVWLAKKSKEAQQQNQSLQGTPGKVPLPATEPGARRS